MGSHDGTLRGGASHVDGNALAGPLSELFRDDMTTATGCCAHCGDTAVLARALVYAVAPGWTVRCSACGEVLMTLARIGERLRIDLRGVSSLEVGRFTASVPRSGYTVEGDALAPLTD